MFENIYPTKKQSYQNSPMFCIFLFAAQVWHRDLIRITSSTDNPFLVSASWTLINTETGLYISVFISVQLAPPKNMNQLARAARLQPVADNPVWFSHGSSRALLRFLCRAFFKVSWVFKDYTDYIQQNIRASPGHQSLFTRFLYFCASKTLSCKL